MRSKTRVLVAAVAAALMVLPALPAAAQENACVGGSPDSPAKLEVFSDFQCPACQQFYLRTVRQVLADFSSKNKVCVVYHEFPLAMHQYAREAARYAAAAHKLGNDQWIRVADRLFVDQALWTASGNVEASVKKALTAGDFAKVKEFMKDPAIDAAIDRDIAEGRQRGVQSTPTFFVQVNGREQKAAGAMSYTTLRNFLNQQLAGQ